MFVVTQFEFRARSPIAARPPPSRRCQDHGKTKRAVETRQTLAVMAVVLVVAKRRRRERACA